MLSFNRSVAKGGAGGSICPPPPPPSPITKCLFFTSVTSLPVTDMQMTIIMCATIRYHQGLLMNLYTTFNLFMNPPNKNYRHTSIFSLNYSCDRAFFEPKRISDMLEVTLQESQLTSNKGDQADDAMNLLPRM